MEKNKPGSIIDRIAHMSPKNKLMAGLIMAFATALGGLGIFSLKVKSDAKDISERMGLSASPEDAGGFVKARMSEIEQNEHRVPVELSAPVDLPPETKPVVENNGPIGPQLDPDDPFAGLTPEQRERAIRIMKMLKDMPLSYDIKIPEDLDKIRKLLEGFNLTDEQILKGLAKIEEIMADDLAKYKLGLGSFTQDDLKSMMSQAYVEYTGQVLGSLAGFKYDPNSTVPQGQQLATYMNSLTPKKKQEALDAFNKLTPSQRAAYGISFEEQFNNMLMQYGYNAGAWDLGK